jgi:hypothetical protein
MKYTINGKKVTREEFAARHEGNGKLEAILETRQFPGGHEPYWGTGHESVSCSVPAGQAKEHHEWCQSQGLVDYSIDANGDVKHGSPEGRKKYLKARGMADAGGAGSDARASTIKRGT